jgi:hypothetical protein
MTTALFEDAPGQADSVHVAPVSDFRDDDRQKAIVNLADDAVGKIEDGRMG